MRQKSVAKRICCTPCDANGREDVLRESVLPSPIRLCRTSACKYTDNKLTVTSHLSGDYFENLIDNQLLCAGMV